MLRVLDLFSGIGGFSLGLERTGGFKTVAFCEIEPYCRRVLAKHWPEVPCYDDVRTLSAERLADDGIKIDAICGGFPCQDISFAGNGAGLAGERSGLWFEYARLIGEIRPRYVIVENVAAMLVRGIGDVLGTLAALGYDAEWHCIPASYIGAPHRRDRIWIVAHTHASGWNLSCGSKQKTFFKYETIGTSKTRIPSAVADGSKILADADIQGLSNRRQARQQNGTNEAKWGMAFAEFKRRGGARWPVEPDVGRVAHGISGRVDRLKALGNAVVPQIPELIGRAILRAEGLA